MDKEIPDSTYLLITELIYYGHMELVRQADETLSQKGFGRPHYRVLHIIKNNPGMTTKKLLLHLKITAASLNRTMNKLIDAKYILQKNDLNDRRQRHHFLTKSGNDFQEKIYSLQKKVLKDAFDKVEGESLESFIKVLAYMISEDDHSLLSVPIPF
jgi:DNA-binding MarR family transcriptional regulator